MDVSPNESSGQQMQPQTLPPLPQLWVGYLLGSQLSSRKSSKARTTLQTCPLPTSPFLICISSF